MDNIDLNNDDSKIDNSKIYDENSSNDGNNTNSSNLNNLDTINELNIKFGHSDPLHELADFNTKIADFNNTTSVAAFNTDKNNNNNNNNTNSNSTDNLQYFNYPTLENISNASYLFNNLNRQLNTLDPELSYNFNIPIDVPETLDQTNRGENNNIVSNSNDLMEFEKMLLNTPTTTTTTTASSIYSSKTATHTNKGILLTNPNAPKYFFKPPQFNLQREISSLVKLAHRNKDIKLTDMEDKTKVKAFQQKVLKKLKRKAKASKRQPKKQTALDVSKRKKSIGRPLTPKTKVRLTLVPNLPTLYSMLVTESIDISDYKSRNNKPIDFVKMPLFNTDIKDKFKVLKRGTINGMLAYEELLFNNSVDWRFKTTTSVSHSGMSPLNLQSTTTTTTINTGNFPGKSQTVTFLDVNDDSINVVNQQHNGKFPSSVGHEDDDTNVPIYKSIDTAVREIFNLEEYTFLRITRAAAFEKTGSVVLKMETVKPGCKWLDDDEFDLKIIFKLFGNEDTDFDSLDWDLLSDAKDDLNTNIKEPISTTFLKKKIARPRYKSNMRIYLIPRTSDVVLYTRESMLKRDIINGTLDLSDDSDPRMIITAFDYENVLKYLKVI